MRRIALIAVVLCAIVLLTGCLAGPNDLARTPREGDSVAGFWRGLWHGIISPVTFIVSLFVKSVHFYEVHNNGNWYNLGFVLGAGILFGGGAASRHRSKD